MAHQPFVFNTNRLQRRLQGFRELIHEESNENILTLRQTTLTAIERNLQGLPIAFRRLFQQYLHLDDSFQNQLHIDLMATTDMPALQQPQQRTNAKLFERNILYLMILNSRQPSHPEGPAEDGSNFDTLMRRLAARP